MGKKKMITPVGSSTTTNTPVPTTAQASAPTATNKAPPYERQPSALSSDGGILWEELEKELQENNLR